MAVPLNQVNTASDTWQVAINDLNAAINAIGTVVVTANNLANGSITTGNAFVNGIFAATTLAAQTLGGGNVQSQANLTVSTNAVFGNSTVNSSVNSTALSLGSDRSVTSSFTFTTTGTSLQTVDSFLNTFRSARYLVSVNDNNANGHQSSEIMVLYDGTNALVTEFAQLVSNSVLVTFSATANSTAVLLQATPVSTNTTIKSHRTLVSS